MLQEECFIKSVEENCSDVRHISMTSYKKLTYKAVGEIII